MNPYIPGYPCHCLEQMLLDAEIFDETREGNGASLEVAKSGPGPGQEPFR